MSTHYGRGPDRSAVIRKTLNLLLERGETGATGDDIREATNTIAAHSSIHALRSWVRATGAPYDIPRARCEGRNENGRMIYRYYAFRRSPAVTIRIESNGQLTFL